MGNLDRIFHRHGGMCPPGVPCVFDDIPSEAPSSAALLPYVHWEATDSD